MFARKKNTASILAMAFISLLLCGCEAERPQNAPPPKVLFSVVQGESLALGAELPGRISAYMVSEVRPQVSGIIQKRLFEEGSDVREGQQLYQIDPSLFTAAFNNAQANLAKAEANEISARLLSERYNKLVKINAVSKQECDDALAAYRQAKAEVQAAKESLQTARINLSYTQVTAPVSGRVGRSFVTPGALVTQNQPEPLSTIQHLDSVYVDITQSNTELLRLRRALEKGHLKSNGKDAARIRLRLEDGTPYAVRQPDENSDAEPEWIEGELLFSDVTIDKSTGAVNLRARFPNPDKILLPGMYVRAIVEEGVMEAAVLVPQKSVLRDNRGRAFVYVLHEEPAADSGTGDTYQVQMRHVEIVRSVGARWLVNSGLEPGERLLVEGHMKARNGQLVSGSPVIPSETFSASLKQSETVR